MEGSVMYHCIEYLHDGTKEGATDWLVASYLASLVNYKNLRTATLYVRVKTCLKDIAGYLHTHPQKVKAALYRLQEQSRIQIVSDPCRGRNYLLLNIGIDAKGSKTTKGKFAKTKVLFSPSLTPEVIWKMTADNLSKAKTKEDKVRCLQYLIQVTDRADHPDKEARLIKLKEKIEELEGSTGV